MFHKCNLSLQISIKATNDGDVMPAKNLQLTIAAQKNSLLGFHFVDQSVYYLRNKSRVTHKKVRIKSVYAMTSSYEEIHST